MHRQIHENRDRDRNQPARDMEAGLNEMEVKCVASAKELSSLE
jgi:hypothetical protein